MINYFLKKVHFFIIFVIPMFYIYSTVLAEETTGRSLCAWLDDQNIITVWLKDKIPFDEKIKSKFKVMNSQGKELSILKLASFPDNQSVSSVVTIYLEQPIAELTTSYYITLDNVGKAPIVPRKILDRDEYYYSGSDLGFSYKSTGTIFKIWAPTALAINVRIYGHYNSNENNFSQKQPLMKKEKGVWTAFVAGDLKDKYYLFEITQYYDGEIKTLLVQDPYSTGSAVNSSKSYVFDMDDVNFYVPGWGEDKYVTLKNNADAILYELHVRDYTIDPSSGVDPVFAGRYKGLSQYNTLTDDKMSTGLNNLIELGVTHIQLLPVFDYGTGNEAENNITYTWYNSGYNPVLYNNVEGSYSSNPNGISRYVELKTMIQYLHLAGLGVVLDVDYIHTFKNGLADFSIFDKVVPHYFYRSGNDASCIDSLESNNYIATERPMVRKFIIDSLQYWEREYHVDGFRLNNMGIVDKETINQICNIVKTMNPNAIICGTIDSRTLKQNAPNEIKVQTNELDSYKNIAFLNDNIHEDLIGGVSKNTPLGYLQGNNTKNRLERLKKQIQGDSIRSTNSNVLLGSPNDNVNYTSYHGISTVWDQLATSMPEASRENLLKRYMLGLGLIIFSQGVPFIAEGDEFARTKNGNKNSDDNNDPSVNPVNWNLKKQNRVVFDFCKGLITLRKAHSAFRMTDPTIVRKNLKFFNNLPAGIIAYALINNANNDEWKTIVVGFNNTDKNYVLTVAGTWKVVAQKDKASVDFFNIVQNNLEIPAMGMLIVYGDYDIEPFEF